MTEQDLNLKHEDRDHWDQRKKSKLQTEVIYLINFHVDPEVIFEPAYGLVSSQVKLLSSSLGP